MCGIAGIAFTTGLSTAESAVCAMLPSLRRRGPDGEGIHLWPNAGFGHCRLAIIDLSPAGAQPMLSADGAVGVVFNGCIYNFQEIRRELETRGHTFRSQCDTEVLIEGYREWGADALLSRLRGMFAFAIWDEPRRTLTLARDRLGVKPLVYSLSDSRIAFASTLDALRAAGFTGEIDRQSALEFLDLGFVTEERSIFTGTRKLPPATLMEWRDGKIIERTYWTLPEADAASPVRFEEAVEETERLIVEAVRLRLISDVPIGALLSGGIDSTLVCWALSKLRANVRAFTVGTPGDSEDESQQAREIARQLGVPHEVVNLGEDARAPLEELTAAFSEPFASTSALGMLRVSKTVRSKATVLLTGDGGDDVFLGYPFFQNAWKAQQLAGKLPAVSAALWKLARPLTRSIPAMRRFSNFIDYSVGGIGAYGRVRLGLPYFNHRSLLGARLRGQGVAYRQVPDSFVSSRRLLRDVSQFHRRMHFTSEFMTKVDGGTMFYSLEARAPFLDQALWEYAATLPPAIHFHGGMLKAVLREIVRRDVGPDVAFRPKQGFTIPVEKWLATKWSGHLKELKGDDTLLVREGWIEPAALTAAVNEALNQRELPKQLFHTLVFEHWLRRNKA
ncbi:MAG TPA: asparagine synthase (glutamine-hydrolyzing) [Bryobacteraceae bacterium]|nr:asparagine synthase (glutamine-hydrolyzing) [Bryobacteraceae bacterium]